MSNLLAIRKKLKLTQSEMATLLGMSQGSVSFYEKGLITMPPNVAARLIEIAGTRGKKLTFDQIYGGEAVKTA